MTIYVGISAGEYFGKVLEILTAWVLSFTAMCCCSWSMFEPAMTWIDQVSPLLIVKEDCDSDEDKEEEDEGDDAWWCCISTSEATSGLERSELVAAYHVSFM